MATLEALMTEVNSWKPSVKLNFEYSQYKRLFLDVEIHKEPVDHRVIIHRPFYKAADTHQLLAYNYR